MSSKKSRLTLVVPFSRLRMKHVAQVGGKNASLGEMIHSLAPRGIPIPDGFATTAAAYWEFIDANGLRKVIKTELKDLDVSKSADVAARAGRIRQAILEAKMPDNFRAAIVKAYGELGDKTPLPPFNKGVVHKTKTPLVKGGNKGGLDVAVRSSATAEDLPTASFAGQQDSFLHISGEDEVVWAVQRCIASLFNDRAVVYRVNNKFNHMRVALSAGVQQMIRSDLASAGVIFTLDTESGFRDVCVINAAYGLGESVVQGKVNPDQYVVHKPLLAKGFKPIVERRLGDKATKIIYETSTSQILRLRRTSLRMTEGKMSGMTKGEMGSTVQVKVAPKDKARFVLDDKDVLTLACWGAEIEKYYSKQAGYHKPMDIEWAKDGKTGKLYIVQARPETVASRKTGNMREVFHLHGKGKVLLSGVAVGRKIGAGKVRILHAAKDMSAFKDGEVLVAHMTDPDWVPVMKRAAAIITESGGRTCHAAIVSRELGIPCVVGCANALKILKNGEMVTVSAAQGEDGHVYQGSLAFEVKHEPLRRPDKLKTKVMAIVGDPDAALELGMMPVDGVGLARMEFILNQAVKVHPMALLEPKKITNPVVRAKIASLTCNDKNGKEYFVRTLAEGIGKLAAAFYPRPVIVRMSDFKTNEYANLLGGAPFEPTEDNPMLGWRGASRYYDPSPYAPAFALECAAVKRVREEMGLTNLKVMIPFCRTVEEGKRVVAEMTKNGLKRHPSTSSGRVKNGLQIYVMVEIPSNVILATEFAKVFDGFSIGSNDLTQLTLGVDRDSALVSHLYDERNPAVKALLSAAIKSAKKSHTPVGICGQAPSDYPEIAKFLVEQGIDSISLNPDSVMEGMKLIARMERR